MRQCKNARAVSVSSKCETALALRWRIGGAVALGCLGPGLGGLDLTIARRCVGDERAEQLMRGCSHLLDSALESGLIGLGRPRKAAQLADEAARGRVDLLLGRG